MKYEDMIASIEAVIDRDAGIVANLSNISAIIKYSMERVNWAGFYLRRGEELILGPFAGKVACVRIPLGKGVCGTAAAENQIRLVPDVEAFPGHIACDAASRSELVIPLRDRAGNPMGVLDLDSDIPDRFHEEEVSALVRVAELAQELLQAGTYGF